jgi:membrane-associated protease RseP (regulator of RpoE activity)
MERLNLGTLITRGGAAALFTLAVGYSAGAQVVGAVRVMQRDSTVFSRMVPSKATMDSIAVLVRALESEPLGSPSAAALRRQIDALMPRQATIMMTKRGGGPPAFPTGWIGFTAQGPQNEHITDEGDYIQYFAYPSIIAVDPDSPAQKVGIAPGDMLVAYNGLDVRGREFNLTQLLVPDRKITVTVRRDGETKDYAVTAVKTPETVARRRIEFRALPGGDVSFETIIRPEDGQPRAAVAGVFAFPRGGMVVRDGSMLPARAFLISPNGALGAILSSVSSELAKTLKLEPGVLVNDVTDDTPASKAGLHAGDVIVSASGQPVLTLRAFQEILRTRLSDQTLALKVVRDRKPRNVTVSW